MPYIPKTNREKLTPKIESILEEIKELNVGELNFIISSIIWKIFDRKPSYTIANNLIGCLECVKQEFIRRRLNGYEDEKINENGDI